jgi:hypothetical protein
MKTKSFYLLTFLFIGILPTQSNSSNYSSQEKYAQPLLDTISMRIGTPRKPRQGAEFGTSRGRWRARIIHSRGLCRDKYKSQVDGSIRKKIVFKKDDELYFKSRWIRKPIILTNRLDHNENERLIVGIEAFLLKADTIVNYVDGRLIGLSKNYKPTEIRIYADSIFIGHPDLLGRFALPKDSDGNVRLTITVDFQSAKKRANYIYSDNECPVDCDSLTWEERTSNDCCETIITRLDVETGEEVRAQVVIVYDDDSKMLRHLIRFGISSLHNSLQ